MHEYVTVFILKEHFLNKKWNKITVTLQTDVQYSFTEKMYWQFDVWQIYLQTYVQKHIEDVLCIWTNWMHILSL